MTLEAQLGKYADWHRWAVGALNVMAELRNVDFSPPFVRRMLQFRMVASEVLPCPCRRMRELALADVT